MNVKRIQVSIALLLVVLYAGFLGYALTRGAWAGAGVLVVFLIVAVVMLRQRMRSGEPISFLTTLVRLVLGRRGA